MNITENQLYKIAYKEIFRDGMTHQEVYEKYEIDSNLGPETVARTISNIPSKTKLESTKALWMGYMMMLGAVLLTRLIILVAMNQFSTLDIAGLIFMLVIAVGAPVMGIMAVFKGRVRMFPLAALFLITGFFHGIFSDDYGTPTLGYAFAGICLGTMILSTFIPRRWKVHYSKYIIEKEKNGKIVKRNRYSFDETKTMTRKEVRAEIWG